MISREIQNRLRAQVQKIRRSENTMAECRWEIGSILNRSYGYMVEQHEPSFSGTRDPARIPADDMVELMEILRVAPTMIRKMRQFNSMARTREDAKAVIEEYGTWSDICNGYLPGRPAEETKAKTQAKNAGTKARHQEARKMAQHAHAEIPDTIRDYFAEMGDPEQLINQMLVKLGPLGIEDALVQLRIIKRPRRPRIRVAS